MKATSRRCPKCDGELAPSAPEGLCPKCLLAFLVSGFPEEAGDPPDAAPGSRTGDSRSGGQVLERFGDYELIEVLGRGGMGIVYRARQIRLNRVVALKMIPHERLPGEAEIKRFRAEAEAAASLDHPHLVPIYEVGEHEGRHFYAMKLLAGGSLAERISNLQSQISNGEAATLLAIIARAVHHAHQHGILHRDLKPSNILLDEQGQPQVADFGLARRLDGDSSLTLTGGVVGTPNYMAPEQAEGKSRQLTTAADVWSLGAIFYQLLTRQLPFPADTPLETMRHAREVEPKRPSSIQARVDRDLETICLKCLEKEPQKRYGSAEALAEDLERWLRHEPIRARPAGLWEQGLKWGKRHPARAGLLGVALAAPALIIAVLLVYQARLRHEHSLTLDERNNAFRQEQRATNALARAETEAARAESEARRAAQTEAQTRQRLYAADMLLAQHALDDGNLALARRLVQTWRPQGMTNEELRVTNGTVSSSRPAALAWPC